MWIDSEGFHDGIDVTITDVLSGGTLELDQGGDQINLKAEQAYKLFKFLESRFEQRTITILKAE